MSEPLDESAEQRGRLAHVAKFHVEGGDSALLPCCQRPENLTREHQVPQYDGVVVRLCRRCGHRHFIMRAGEGRLYRP